MQGPVSEQPEQMPSSARCDECQVTTRWLGFYRVWQGSGEVFDTVDLFLPDVQFNTQVGHPSSHPSARNQPVLSQGMSILPEGPMHGQAALDRVQLPSEVIAACIVLLGVQAAYIRVPQSARMALQAEGLPFRDGLHAASHALANVVPLFLLCNASDLGNECDNPYDTRFRPERLLVYDKHPGGIGLAKQVCTLQLSADLALAADQLYCLMLWPSCYAYIGCMVLH